MMIHLLNVIHYDKHLIYFITYIKMVKALWYTRLFFYKDVEAGICLKSKSILRMFWGSNSKQHWIFLLTSKIAMLFVYTRFLIQNISTLVFKITIGYINEFSRKQKFPIRMHQEYLGLIFGRNIRMLRLDEKKHNFY